MMSNKDYLREEDISFVKDKFKVFFYIKHTYDLTNLSIFINSLEGYFLDIRNKFNENTEEWKSYNIYYTRIKGTKEREFRDAENAHSKMYDRKGMLSKTKVKDYEGYYNLVLKQLKEDIILILNG